MVRPGGIPAGPASVLGTMAAHAIAGGAALTIGTG